MSPALAARVDEAPRETERPRLLVDETHMGRRASGIERITADLFGAHALPELDVRPVRASGSRAAMVFAQMLANPLKAARRRDSLWVFPGYPPSPAFALAPERCVLYVHDLFLLTRRSDLNRAAKIYMAAPFRLALSRLRHFLVNSETTGRELAAHVAPAATILPYRPEVRNVFALEPRETRAADDARAPLVLGALGTVEPRKNFLAAARLREALQARLSRPVELHIIGRRGWGDDYEALSREPSVRLHGFLDDEEIRAVFAGFDFFVCTSHAEGLGLPLLESQYAGIPVVAPDQAIFREVLGRSGLFVDPGDPAAAAGAIARALDEGWQARAPAAAAANLARWNAQAAGDRMRVIELFRTLARGLGSLHHPQGDQS